MGDFSAKYGVFTFIVEAARDRVFGTIDEVRSERLVDLLNYIAYKRSEFNLTKDMNAINE